MRTDDPHARRLAAPALALVLVTACGAHVDGGAAGDEPAGDADAAGREGDAGVPDAQPAAARRPGVYTQHNDPARTGSYTAETALDVRSVAAATFGKLLELPVDGDVYAQPLYVPDVAMGGRARNVLYVATMHNGVFAFDADARDTPDRLWSVNLGPSTPVAELQGSSDQGIRSEVGVTGTPVIDPASGTMYLVARTRDAGGAYHQWLHALDVATGQERPGGPREIAAKIAGTGTGSAQGMIAFDPKIQNQRAGLLLLDGVVFIAWGAHDDTGPYHGWVLGYDARTLAQVAVFNTTPAGRQGGIWQAGSGLASDGSSLYVLTGNGSYDAAAARPVNVGDSIIKLRFDPAAGLVLDDWFTPSNQAYLDMVDLDLGSAGAMVVPGTSLVVGGGKEGKLYLLDRGKMGGFDARGDHSLQTFQATPACDQPVTFPGHQCYHIHSSPTCWNGPGGPLVYIWAERDYLRAFRLQGQQLGPMPAGRSAMKVPLGMPGAALSISSNGASAGSGVVWATHPYDQDPRMDVDATNRVVPGIVRAFDAADVTHELWNSDTARDRLGNFAKFCPPTVAGGRVHVATFSNKVVVYGLLAR